MRQVKRSIFYLMLIILTADVYLFSYICRHFPLYFTFKKRDKNKLLFFFLRQLVPRQFICAIVLTANRFCDFFLLFEYGSLVEHTP